LDALMTLVFDRRRPRPAALMLAPWIGAMIGLCAPGSAAARPGDVGAVTVVGSGVSGAAVVVQGDGRATVAGSARGRGFLVARVKGNGARDRTFGRNGSVTIRFRGATAAGARAVALFRDGRILVAGNVTVGGVRRIAVARLLPGGGRDPNFDTGVIGPRGAQVEAMALQPEGELVLAGSLPNGARRAALVVRLLADGSPDPGFGGGGAVDSRAALLAGRARDVLVLPNGKLALAVSTERGRLAQGTFVAARLLPNGAFGPSFDEDGIARVATTARRLRGGGAAAIARDARGRLVLGGTAALAPGGPGGSVVGGAAGGGVRPAATVVRLTATGAAAGVGQLRGRSMSVADMARDGRGRLVLAGRVTGLGAAVLRLRANLRLDRSFGAGGLSAGRLPATRPAALALRQSAIVLAGSARIRGHGRLVVARYR
jgi:uncharacterized delta-60 repeat protein